jgi:hypothetical protein
VGRVSWYFKCRKRVVFFRRAISVCVTGLCCEFTEEFSISQECLCLPIILQIKSLFYIGRILKIPDVQFVKRETSLQGK